MKRREFIIGIGAVSLLTACRTSGDSAGGYSGPVQYAKYFKRGHPENVIDDIIVQMSNEAWELGYLPRGQLLRWDWGHRIRVIQDPVVMWKHKFPLVEKPSKNYPYGAVATASDANTIRIGNDPDYVYKRSLWIHEGGHLVAFVNGFDDGEEHHKLFPKFFKRNNGR